MKIDVHTHIFPSDMIQNRRNYFEGEPAFELLYGSQRARLATAADLIQAMDEEGIDRSVVFGFPWRREDRAKRHNDYVLESSAKYQDRLIPLACVDPLCSYAVNEAERCLAAGARGLGEIAIYGPCDAELGLNAMEELAVLCRDCGAVLLVHANEPVGHAYPGKAALGLKFFYNLAKLCAGVRLILAHWGGGLAFFESLKKEAREVLANVHYDTAASPYLYQPQIYSIMRQIVGTEKILMGSDFPLLSPRRYRDEMKVAGLAEADLVAIEGLNAARVFQL